MNKEQSHVLDRLAERLGRSVLGRREKAWRSPTLIDTDLHMIQTQKQSATKKAQRLIDGLV